MTTQVNRQYIGARYVPKFFDNPDGSAEWIQGVAYEALIIVTYAGNSYTSRKPVPSTIGSPNINTEYWANTGNYNAQVEFLREEVIGYRETAEQTQQQLEEETSNRIAGDTNLNKKILTARPIITSTDVILFISDSYASYPSTTNNWMTMLASKLGISQNNYYISAAGSTGFASTSGGQNFITLMQNATVPDKTRITKIIVGGGANDIYYGTYSTITSGIQTFVNSAKTLYPNAQIIIGCIGYTTEKAGITRMNAVKAYLDCSNFGAYPVKNIYYVMQNQTFIIDTTHPTTAGAEMIAEKFYDFFATGECHVTHIFQSSNQSPVFPPFINITEILIDDVYSLVSDGISLTDISVTAQVGDITLLYNNAKTKLSIGGPEGIVRFPLTFKQNNVEKTIIGYIINHMIYIMTNLEIVTLNSITTQPVALTVHSLTC